MELNTTPQKILANLFLVLEIKYMTIRNWLAFAQSMRLCCTTIPVINVISYHILTYQAESVLRVELISLMIRSKKLVLVAINLKDFSGTTGLVSNASILSILISKITVVLNVLAMKHLTLILSNVKIVL
jgi:hypothetical protein